MSPSDDAPETSVLGLSARQRTAVATAVTILAAVVILGALAALGWVAAVFLRKFSHVFLPLAVGGVAALVFAPYYRLLRKRLKFPMPLAVVGVFLSVLLPLVGFAWFFGAIAVEQVSDMVERFPEWWQHTVAEAKARWPEVKEFLDTNPWALRGREALENLQPALIEGAQSFVTRAASAGAGILGGLGALAAWAVLPVYFVFFLIAEARVDRRFEAYLPFLKPETRKDVVYLVSEFVSIVVAFFRGQLIIAFLQGVLFAIGFSAVGLRYGFVLGLLLGFLNIIPYLGSIIGLGIGLPLAFFQDGGGLLTVGLVIAVFTVVQMIEGYLLTPKIMGDRTGLHPVAIIVAVFFWGSALGGIFGMILAIPLTAFLVVFWRLARERYIGELV